MFKFYLDVYRSGLIIFCGVNVEIDFDINGSEAKYAFREFDNGRFKGRNPITRHPNILRAIIIGKKGWGLWVKSWTKGIVDWTFTKEEILQQFIDKKIVIPNSLMLEWDNLILKKKIERNEIYFNQLKKKL